MDALFGNQPSAASLEGAIDVPGTQGVIPAAGERLSALFGPPGSPMVSAAAPEPSTAPTPPPVPPTKPVPTTKDDPLMKLAAYAMLTNAGANLATALRPTPRSRFEPIAPGFLPRASAPPFAPTAPLFAQLLLSQQPGQRRLTLRDLMG